MSASYAMNPEAVASHYDDLDPFYREIWGEHVHHGVWRTGQESDLEAAENLVSMVAKAGGIDSGSQVCDVGCGYGATAKILVQRYGAKVTGLTLSDVQLQYALQYNSVAGSTTYLLQDWCQNQLPSGQFDAVLSVESMEHMPNLNSFFQESARVLKPAGRLVICAWMACEHPNAAASHRVSR